MREAGSATGWLAMRLQTRRDVTRSELLRLAAGLRRAAEALEKLAR